MVFDGYIDSYRLFASLRELSVANIIFGWILNLTILPSMHATTALQLAKLQGAMQMTVSHLSVNHDSFHAATV